MISITVLSGIIREFLESYTPRIPSFCNSACWWIFLKEKILYKTLLKILRFLLYLHQLGPLGWVGHKVAILFCPSVCLSDRLCHRKTPTSEGQKLIWWKVLERFFNSYDQIYERIFFWCLVLRFFNFLSTKISVNWLKSTP